MKLFFLLFNKHIRNKFIFKKQFLLGLVLASLLLSPTTTYATNKSNIVHIDPIQKSQQRVLSSKTFDPFTFVGATTAWSSYESEKEIIVAVIDTGIDISHEDLASNIWTNTLEIPGNGIDDDGNGYVDDQNGWNFYDNSPILCSYNEKGTSNSANNDDHGTHVAGIIGAIGNNGIGINGVASNVQVKIMPLKVTGGTNGTGRTSSLIKAIQYASNMGASICNISLNTSTYNEELYVTMLKSNMLFVCSAGNQKANGVNIDEIPTYPASFSLPNIISVSALDTHGQLASYSNYGNDSVEIAAPGSSIYSTLVGNTYGRFTGTSMATPFVSGASAMLMTLNSKYYPSEIKQILVESSTPISSLQGKVVSSGALNITNALSLLETGVHEKDITAPKLKLSKVNGQISIQVSDKQSGVKSLLYLKGNRSKTAFKKGQLGTDVTALTLDLEQGTYTFYCSDWAGNDIVKTITMSR